MNYLYAKFEKSMILRHLFVIFLLLSLTLNSNGQLSYGGIPASFNILKKAAALIPVIDMESVDNDRLLNDEQSDPKNLKAFYFAKTFNVDISPNSSGRWENTKDMKIWRIGLRSKGAWSLNLIFDKMIIPKGASLFIYSKGHEKVLGAFTSENEQSSGYFSTYPIPGDEIVVEYNEPVGSAYPGELHLSSVNHDYKNIFGTRPLGESDTCNMDVFCPDAAAYLIQKQAVVNLIVAGRELCTGTLVNNTKQDKTPYVLTAGHCISSASDAQQTVFCFNYESPACRNGAKSSINGYADQTLSGAVLKSRSDSLDFALIQLETAPPAEYRPYYAGWDRSLIIPSSTAAIHHPKGDVKKICKDYNPPTIGSYNSDFISKGFWIIGRWEIGTTEAGSSGCGLLNQNKLLVGTLTGGSSTCTTPTNDLFAMFNKQWDYYKTSDQQLKVWLDPNNTGATELAGLNPFGSDSCALFTNAVDGEVFTLQKVSNQSGGYKSGHNGLRINGYAERFGKTSRTLLSSVSIGVARVYSTVSNLNSKITMKIYGEDIISGLPGSELIVMDLPFSLLSEKKMNHIVLDNPIVIQKNYFIGFDINYSNPTDTFAVYHTVGRLKNSANDAFARYNGSWKPFYWIPELGISSSLLINANGCQNTLAIDNTPTVDEALKFEVLYPLTVNTDYILLRNKGAEEYCVVSLYDILGHKLFTGERLLSNTPKEISMAHYHTGVYFLTVETVSAKQVIKIVVKKSN